MGIKRKKEKKVRLVAVLTGFILMFGFAAISPLPCSGMEALTQEELGDLSGSIGVTLTFINPVTVRATFTALTFGDTDGWGDGTGSDNNAGWLVLVGSGTNTAELKVELPAASELEVSVGTTGASACSPEGGAPYAGLSIPAGTSFFTFSLTETNIILTTPDTINIGLSRSAYSVGDIMGYMKAENVAIDKANKKSTCYIWAH